MSDDLVTAQAAAGKAGLSSMPIGTADGTPPAPPPLDGKPVGGHWIVRRAPWLVGGYLVTCWAACMAIFIALWPGFGQAEIAGNKHLLSEVRFLGLVAAAGALGACLQAVTSFAGYVGNRKFTTDWALWYVSRPPIGATMAVIFLPLVGAGLIPENAENVPSFAYSLISLGILVGMFSKNAADKLADVFDALMTSSRDENRGGKLVVDTPQVLSLTPSTITAGTTVLRLQASGSGFAEATVILVNGQPRQTAYQDTRTLFFTLDPSDVATAGTLSITARTPAPDKTLEGAGVSLAVVA